MSLKLSSLVKNGTNSAPQASQTRQPRGRPTRERSKELDRLLLDRALDLFLERGYGGTTIEAVIEAVGTARRTVYARYGDKLSLFKAAVEYAIDDLVLPPEQLCREETNDLEETLINVATLVHQRMMSPAGLRLTQVAIAEIYRIPEFVPYLYERTSKVTIDYLTDLFDRRLPSESSADLAMAFNTLAIDGLYQVAFWMPMAEDEFRRQVVFRVRLVLRGAGLHSQIARVGS